jgi:RNA polymerase sigma-70 factor (sigma-E family)
MEKATSAELYRQHAPQALRLAYLLTSDRDAAHDLIQDAFIKVLGRVRTLREPSAFDAYLRRTIVNLSRSRFRRLALERRYAGEQTEGLTQEHPHEEREEIRRALATLPERQRAAIVLRYYEDLSEQQTADAMHTSVAAVKSLAQRAMRALREQLEGEAQ